MYLCDFFTAVSSAQIIFGIHTRTRQIGNFSFMSGCNLCFKNTDEITPSEIINCQQVYTTRGIRKMCESLVQSSRAIFMGLVGGVAQACYLLHLRYFSELHQFTKLYTVYLLNIKKMRCGCKRKSALELSLFVNSFISSLMTT